MSAALPILLLACSSGSGRGGTDSAASDGGETGASSVEVPAACEGTMSQAAFQTRREQLAGLTEPVWGDHAPADSRIVWFEPVETGVCHVLWAGGAVAAVTVLDEAPVLGFGSFGWMLPYAPDGWSAVLDQPDALRAWAADAGADRAVILPVSSDYSELVQLQLAIHEAFHVEVQADTWFGSGSAWPSWAGLRLQRGDDLVRCYDGASAEQALLAEAVDGSCAGAAAYLAARDARWEDHAAAMVPDTSGGAVPCPDAEAVYEAIEGMADWASWGAMHRAGLVPDDVLHARLTAVTDEPFYQLGAAQILWLAARDHDAAQLGAQVAADDDPAAGPRAHFEAAVAADCP